MGLFGGLFDKKHCCICGGEIGLLGNRKLEDGNLCKHCAAKLSPWFSDRRHSTVQEIAAQLDYREANMDRAAAFRPTRIYGDDYRKLYIDDNDQTIAVATSQNFAKDNPDIVDYVQVIDCKPDIQEFRHEMKHKGPDGREVPFEPRRYRYSYDFHVIIAIDSPFFDEMRFDLNTSSVPGDDRAECERYITMIEDVVETLTGSRPSLAARCPSRPPLCPECGNPLSELGKCLICHPPVPMHAPHPAPRPMSAPAPKPEPRPTPSPSPRPESRPMGGPASRPESRPMGAPASRSESRPMGAPASRPESRPMGAPASRHESRPMGAPASRPSDNGHSPKGPMSSQSPTARPNTPGHSGPGGNTNRPDGHGPQRPPRGH